MINFSLFLCICFWKNMHKISLLHVFLFQMIVFLSDYITSLFTTNLTEFKCMFQAILSLSADGIIIKKTMLHLSGTETFQVTHIETVTFRPPLDAWLPHLHNQSSYNENATNHFRITRLLSGSPPPHLSLHTKRKALTFQLESENRGIL